MQPLLGDHVQRVHAVQALRGMQSLQPVQRRLTD
jgi:hypothetical protein